MNAPIAKEFFGKNLVEKFLFIMKKNIMKLNKRLYSKILSQPFLSTLMSKDHFMRFENGTIYKRDD